MKNIFFFLIGAIFSFLLANFWNNLKNDTPDAINKDFYILSNQISKMNKMLVLEQNFSSFQTHKSEAFSIGKLRVLPKEMVLYSTAKAQVSYDLKKLKIDVDSTQKKLIIKEIPEAEIKIYPDVKIHFMDDYAVNRFKKQDLNHIMESAKKNMEKSINQNQLKAEGRKQLISNLNDIFILAKTLNYSIEDQTNQIDKSLL